MNTSSPTPQKDNKSKTQFEKKKLILEKKFKENITKDIEFQAPDFVLRSSFLSFVLSGGWRIPVAFIVTTLLLTISILMWSNTFRSEWWIDPFFASDLRQTDCIVVSENITEYIRCDYSESTPPKKILELYTTDYLKELRNSDVVEHLYGFNTSRGYVDGGELNTPILLGTPDTYRLMNYEMAEGDCAFDGGEDMPEVVLSGEEFNGYHVGDTIVLTSSSDMFDYFSAGRYLPKPDEYKPLTVRVAGKVGFPYITQKSQFYVTSETPHIEGDYFSKIFMIYNDKNMEILKDHGFCVLSEDENYYVSYKQDADPAAIESYRNHIRSMFFANTSNFLSEANITPTYNLYQGEIIFSAEKAPEISEPSPKIVRMILPPAPIIFSFLSSLVLILMINLTFNRITSGCGIKGKNSTSLGDAVKTAIFIPLFSAIIPTIALFAVSFKYVGHSPTAPTLISQLVSILFSPYFLKCFAVIFFMLLIIIVPAIIFSFRKFRSAVNSEQMSKESFIYKEAEYYTAESYVPNDFEQADYNAARNYQPSGQPDYYTADSYTPNDFDQADHSTLNAEQSHPFDPTDNNY